MTIKELIEELQHYDEDKEIQIITREDNPEEYYLNFIYQTEENVCIEII